MQLTEDDIHIGFRINKRKLPLEITGKPNVIVLTGYASKYIIKHKLYSLPIEIKQLERKELCMTYRSASISIEGKEVRNKWVGTYTLPDIIGTYKFTFHFTYLNISKTAVRYISVELRKYYGFSDIIPNTVDSLSNSDLSESVAGEITILAQGEGLKNFYIAIPAYMSINKIECEGKSLRYSLLKRIQRTINNEQYTYKLYKSIDYLNSMKDHCLHIT